MSSNSTPPSFNADLRVGSSSVTPAVAESSSASASRGNRGPSWTVEEDGWLCESWIAKSIRSSKGTDLSASVLCESICEDFFQRGGGENVRIGHRSLSNLWSTIQQEVPKFVGCLAHVKALKKSGLTIKNEKEEARKKYKNDTKTIWEYEHCYKKLENEPKFTIERGAKSQSALTPVERPTGRKKAKEQEKEEGMRKRKSDEDWVLLARVVERHAANNRLRIEIQDKINDDEVMREDLAMYSGNEHQYWELRKAEALRNAQSSSSSHRDTGIQ